MSDFEKLVDQLDNYSRLVDSLATACFQLEKAGKLPDSRQRTLIIAKLKELGYEV